MLRILSAHAEIEVCSTADAAEQTDGCADHAEWERYVGRCVSEHADAVTDKELVYHVIEGADEHRDDARNRKTPQKRADRFRAERIFGRFHRGYLLSNEVKVHRLYRVNIPGKLRDYIVYHRKKTENKRVTAIFRKCNRIVAELSAFLKKGLTKMKY